MSKWRDAFARMTSDPRYARYVEWGMPRPGHPEGTIRAHIADLERNLEELRGSLTDDEWWKL